MAQRALFELLSYVPTGMKSSLMGLVTGTRGDNVVYFKPDEPKNIAVTIDDAPSQSVAEFARLLDLLKELALRVTFQVISGYVSSEEHEALLRRAVEEGHQLTNHATEDKPCLNLSADEFASRVDACQALLDRIAPGSKRWFRPPSGLMNRTMREVLRQKGYTVCLGDCYSADPHVNEFEFHVRVLSRAAKGGSIIILHCPEANCRRQTFQVLPKLVGELRDRGYDPVTLDELFG
eukprot:TRINITY_DN44186_c0_g1_i1.p1 TRINITY_DN44186_c0_g1~~TRINITY_DN44186_c0_g1_i1.p1  ORF type:complete len:246 (-),score=35.25 TRINITY_DN44186_c0_g1_i1:132-836(-)